MDISSLLGLLQLRRRRRRHLLCVAHCGYWRWCGRASGERKATKSVLKSEIQWRRPLRRTERDHQLNNYSDFNSNLRGHVWKCEPHHVSAQRHMRESLSDAGQGPRPAYQAATKAQTTVNIILNQSLKGCIRESRPPGKDRRTRGHGGGIHAITVSKGFSSIP